MAREMTERLLQQIQGEYHESPGLHLARLQARRLWSLDQETCDRLLDVLVDARFLRKTERDGYVLADVGR